MRLLCISLIIVHLTGVGCQVENFPSIFDIVSKTADRRVGDDKFIGHREAMNEGSDSFVTSAEMLEPSTPSAVITDKQQVQTIEPLEFTTKADNKAMLKVPNVPAVNSDDTQPLPEEVFVADPFSLDETTKSGDTVDISVVAPVVPVIHTDHTSPSLVAETDDDFLSSTLVMEETTTTAASPMVPVFPSELERRVLKEKEEATVPVLFPTTDVHLEAETAENLPSSTISHFTEAWDEPSQVSEFSQTPVTETSDFEDLTLNFDRSSSSSTASDLTEGNASDFAHAMKSTVELQDEEHLAFTETNPATISSTVAVETTPFDEDEPPFDQEKLSGLFEQDGSFIPDHLINQPTSEPMFPRVELSEESTEIINDQQQKKMSTTTELPTISVSTDDYNESTVVTDLEMLSTKHKLQQIIIQPNFSKPMVNEVSHRGGNLGPDSVEPRIPFATLESGSESSLNQQEASTVAAATKSAEPESEHSVELKTWPTLIPTGDMTITATKSEPELATESVPQTESELPSEPILEMETVHKPKTQPQHVPEPELQRAFGFEPKPQPSAIPHFERKLEPQATLEPDAPESGSEPHHQPEPQPRHEPQAISEPSPKLEPEPEPEPTLRVRPSHPVPEPQPESEVSSGDPRKAVLSMRISSLTFNDEFADKSSGQYKKLSHQIIPHISGILEPILGDNFVGFEITSISKGSVIVEGVILTREDIQDVEELATKIEMSISSNSFLVGTNEIDPMSIAVNGIPSRAYIERAHSSYPQDATSSVLLIGSMIAIGVLIVLVVAFAAIAMINRRTNGTMKLKDDTISRIENGKTVYSNPQAVSVNLTSYGNGTSAAPANGTPMMTSLSIKPNEREVC